MSQISKYYNRSLNLESITIFVGKTLSDRNREKKGGFMFIFHEFPHRYQSREEDQLLRHYFIKHVVSDK